MRLALLSATILAALASAAAALAQPAYRDPPRAWSNGSGQGVVEALVPNNTGGTFNLSCGRDSSFAGRGATIFLTVPRAAIPAAAAENLSGVIEIDGRSYSILFARDAGGPPEATYTATAFNHQATAFFQELVAAMRRGRQMTVYVVGDRVMQAFTLSGASNALAEFRTLDGC